MSDSDNTFMIMLLAFALGWIIGAHMEDNRNDKVVAKIIANHCRNIGHE